MNADKLLQGVGRKAVWGSKVRLAAALTAALVLPSCSEGIRTGQSPAMLVLTSLTGAKGGGSNSGTQSNSLSSDVVTLVPPLTGRPSVFADSGQATLQLLMRDAALSPSPVNAITLTQYHVNFIRADGRNTPGLDVPYGFDGVLQTTIASSGSVNFTLVRVQAKVEAPLAALANNFQVISMIAEVTFYGHDQNGRAVSVSGRLNVDFSDWGD